MGYSVYFFGLDANSVSNRLGSTPKAIVDDAEQLIRDSSRFADEDVQSTVAKVAAICENRLPKYCDAEYFHALCWLGEVVAEKISISSFIGFRHLQFLDDTGIWLPLSQSRPPFGVPKCKAPPPDIGFISSDSMSRVAIPSISHLMPCDYAEANYARQEFLEVLESLVADKLDLLAVLL